MKMLNVAQVALAATCLMVASVGEAQRKGFVPKSEGSATIKKRKRKALPKGPQFKKAERSRAQTKAMAQRDS